MIAPAEDLGGLFQSSAVTLTEEERQATLLALAQLSVCRPERLSALREVARKFSGVLTFQALRQTCGLPAGCPRDTSNAFGVVRIGDKIKVLYWDKVARDHSFTPAGGVVLSAWVGKLSDPGFEEVNRVAKEIEK